MSRSTDSRVSPVFKAMNRPLTVLGAERRLFFVALISGGAIFSLLHSLLGGMGAVHHRRRHRPHCHETRCRDSTCAIQLRQISQAVRPAEVGTHRNHDQEPQCSGLKPSRRTGKKQARCQHRSTSTGSGTSTRFLPSRATSALCCASAGSTTKASTMPDAIMR